MAYCEEHQRLAQFRNRALWRSLGHEGLEFQRPQKTVQWKGLHFNCHLLPFTIALRPVDFVRLRRQSVQLSQPPTIASIRLHGRMDQLQAALSRRDEDLLLAVNASCQQVRR